MKIRITLAPKVWGTFGGWRWNEHRSCQYDADRTEVHQIKSTTPDFDFRRVLICFTRRVYPKRAIKNDHSNEWSFICHER